MCILMKTINYFKIKWTWFFNCKQGAHSKWSTSWARWLWLVLLLRLLLRNTWHLYAVLIQTLQGCQPLKKHCLDLKYNGEYSQYSPMLHWTLKWMYQSPNLRRRSTTWSFKMLQLCWFIMPVGPLNYMEMCYTTTNKLEIYPIRIATIKNGILIFKK